MKFQVGELVADVNNRKGVLFGLEVLKVEEWVWLWLWLWLLVLVLLMSRN